MKQVDLLGGFLEDREYSKSEITDNKCKCYRCKKVTKPPFVFVCGSCMKKYEPHKYARLIAYHTYGSAKAIPCVKCGSNNKVEWHHPDYEKPLKVIPLCKECHTEADKDMISYG